MSVRCLVASAALLLIGLPLGAFEESLEQFLSASSQLEEIRLQREMLELSGREAGLAVAPDFYLSAPAAYSAELPLPASQTWAATLGVRQEFPFGIVANMSWQQSLLRTDPAASDATELFDDQAAASGFSHSLLAQAGLVIPIYGSDYVSIPGVQRLTAFLRAETRSDLQLAGAAHDFLADWFSLYRQRIELERLQQQEAFAIAASDAHEVLVERGEVAPHIQWEYERQVHAARRARIEVENGFAASSVVLRTRYGVIFPDEPRLPAREFFWGEYGVQSLNATADLLAGLDERAADLDHARAQQAVAPDLSLSFSMAGPAQLSAREFWPGFADQFNEWDAWTPSVTVGLSISSTELRAAKVQDDSRKLVSRLTSIQESSASEQRQNEVRILERSFQQYQQAFEVESASLARMREYLRDMRTQFEQGIIDLLTLQEIESAFVSMEASLRVTESYVHETRLELQLLAGKRR